VAQSNAAVVEALVESYCDAMDEGYNDEAARLLGVIVQGFTFKQVQDLFEGHGRGESNVPSRSQHGRARFKASMWGAGRVEDDKVRVLR